MMFVPIVLLLFIAVPVKPFSQGSHIPSKNVTQNPVKDDSNQDENLRSIPDFPASIPAVPPSVHGFQRQRPGFPLDPTASSLAQNAFPVPGQPVHIQFANSNERKHERVHLPHLMRLRPLEGLKPSGGNFMRVPTNAFLPPKRQVVRQPIHVPNTSAFTGVSMNSNKEHVNFGTRLQMMGHQPMRNIPTQNEIVGTVPPKMHATPGPQVRPPVMKIQNEMQGMPAVQPPPQKPVTVPQTQPPQKPVTVPQIQPQVQPQDHSHHKPQKVQHLTPQHSVLVGSSGTHHSVSHLAPPQNMHRPQVTQSVFSTTQAVDKPLAISTTTGIPFIPTASKSPEVSILESVMNAVTRPDVLVNEVTPPPPEVSSTPSTEPPTPTTSSTEAPFSPIIMTTTTKPIWKLSTKKHLIFSTTTEEASSSTTTETSSKASNPWDSIRVSGCNVYGKFFNVDSTIPELSTDCKKCFCSSFGVQCSNVC